MIKVHKIFKYYTINFLKNLEKKFHKHITFKYYDNKIKTWT